MPCFLYSKLWQFLSNYKTLVMCVFLFVCFVLFCLFLFAWFCFVCFFIFSCHLIFNFYFQWNLICDRKFLGATIQSCFFVGMLIGSLVTGMFSDAWGRKKCIFVSNAIMVWLSRKRCGYDVKLPHRKIPEIKSNTDIHH